MAKTSELRALVEQFATELEAIVTGRASAAFAAKFDAVRSQILSSGGSSVAAAKPVKGRVGRPPGSRGRSAAHAKPCPVCGTPNKGRRFSYLCEKHRSTENLAKFKGGKPAGKPTATRRGPSRPPKAGKRGPGRPPKVKTPEAAPKT